jgi:site-specific DNA recombinase
MRVAIYVRVSSQRQAQAQTIDQQLVRLHTHVQAQGWTCPPEQVFRDDGYSGASLKRPGLDRLRDQVAQAQFDRVLITAPDRLARKYIHQMLLLEELERGGATVEFVEHPMSQDPHDQLLLQIRGAVAEYERTLIADRMRRGRQQKYRTGQLLPWTRAPYGYQLAPDHPRDPAGVRLDAPEAAVVTSIFTYYLESSHTLLGLAAHLHALGVPAPRGQARWRASTLRGILTNPVYTGVVYAGRARNVPARHRRSALQPIGRRGSSQPTAPEDWIRVAQVPALVSQQQFDQAATKLTHNQAFARRNNTAHDYLLRALVSCGQCQGACIGCTRGHLSYYRCNRTLRAVQLGHDARCHARYIPVGQLDEVVWQDACTILRQPDQITTAFTRAHGGAWLPQELQAQRDGLRKAAATLAGQLERLTEAYLAAVLNLEEYKRRRAEVEGRQTAVALQMAQLDGRATQQHELAGITTGITEFCARVEQGLAAATFAQKRELVELLIDRVVVTDTEVEIRYAIPTSLRSELIPFCHLRTDYLVAQNLG